MADQRVELWPPAVDTDLFHPCRKSIAMRDRLSNGHPDRPLLLTIVGGTILLIAVGGILVGLGLRDRKPWARVVAIVLGVIALFHPPFGTALGIYTLWVLMSDEGGVEYRRLSSGS